MITSFGSLIYFVLGCSENFVLSLLQDARFDREVDVKTGFHTRCLICMPIKDGEGNVLAVAQVMNKQQAGTEDSNLVFSAQDVSLFRAYTNFCGIGLYQAKILFRSQLETRRSQVSRFLIYVHENASQIILFIGYFPTRGSLVEIGQARSFCRLNSECK